MEQKQFYDYKGYHLVRKNREIYYGNMSDEFVAKIDVQGEHDFKGVNVADKVRVQLLPTSPENFDLSKIKTTNRDTLYEALEHARTWLEKAND